MVYNSVSEGADDPSADDDDDKPHLISKRGLSTQITVQNKQVYYSVDAKIGSAKSQIQLLLDTGSSDLWLPDSSTSKDGSFDALSSKSFQNMTDKFSIKYGDGTYAVGYWGKDDVSIGDLSVSDLQLGVAWNVTAQQGILGIGLPGNEVAKTKYTNFPMLLKQQGKISKATYSLYLNSNDATSGSVLFGAVDKAKYSGDLVNLDLVSITDSGKLMNSPVAFFVNVSSITDTSNSKTYLSKNPTPALLDSGTTLLYAPKEVYKQIGHAYGWGISKLGFINKCESYNNHNITFNFNDKVKINVPVKQLMYPLKHKNGKPLKTWFRRKPLCLVGVMNSESDHFIFGDNFLRSAYVHYDLDEKKVSIAQVRYTNDTDIVED